SQSFNWLKLSSNPTPSARSFIRLKLHPTPHLQPEFQLVETFIQRHTSGQSFNWLKPSSNATPSARSFIRLKLHPTPHLQPGVSSG
ncbi:MAG: hypothetical protein UEP81_09215, partial [Sutterella wadsworthensis]|nr:hypothetical protein [Sutterella wadsworthensis]